jgi:hypothetical protein
MPDLVGVAGTAAPDRRDGLLPVVMQADGGAKADLVLVALEDARALGMEDAALRQRRDGLAGLEGGVKLREGVGPEAPTGQFRVDEVVGLCVVDAQAALDVGTVLRNDRLARRSRRS